MDNLTNYHTHSLYCDGSASIEDFVKEAIRQGFSSYGVSSHSPIPFDTCWNMNRGDLPAYLDEVHFIKKKYEGRIEIYCGLEIDYLDKAPGIYSARFAGEDTSYDIKNRILLDRLEGVPDDERTARFVCAVAAVFPDGTTSVVRETIEGQIGHEIVGANGFGYDPIFYVPEFGCTTAEMTPEQKNKLSHRGKALRAIKILLEEKLNEEEA